MEFWTIFWWTVALVVFLDIDPIIALIIILIIAIMTTDTNVKVKQKDNNAVTNYTIVNEYIPNNKRSKKQVELRNNKACFSENNCFTDIALKKHSNGVLYACNKDKNCYKVK